MGYEISVDDQEAIASIQMNGNMRLREYMEARDRVFEVCRAHSIRRVLIDTRDLMDAGRPSTIDLFEFGASWAQFAQEFPIRLACIMPHDREARDWWKFGETVALNRGLTVQGFEEEEAARAWLRER